MELAFEPITWTKNRRKVSQSKDVVYLVRTDGASSSGQIENDIIDYVVDNIESETGGMYLDEVTISDMIDLKTFKVTAHYKRDDTTSGGGEDSNQDDPEPQYTFSTTGGTMKITAPIKRISKTPSDAEDHLGINVDEEGNVQGTDVVSSCYNFSETHYFKASKVTTEYKKKIAYLTGKINKSAFRGFSEGEVLFLGAEGQRNGDSRDDDWTITFKFSVQQNESNRKVGDLTVSKKGWDFLWVTFKKVVTNGKVKTTPKAAYVDQVLNYEDFGQLGLGK